MQISIIIPTLNEEEYLPKLLESIHEQRFKDLEIIVADAGSKDKTVEIAKKYSVKVFPRPNNLMLNVNKNYGFTKATNEWILNLDADERVTPELRNEIGQILQGHHSGLCGCRG